jgi:hypothetical protein
MRFTGYLLLWAAIFLGKTLYPPVTIAPGITEAPPWSIRNTNSGWKQHFTEHARIRQFTQRASQAAAGNGRIVVAYGGAPEMRGTDPYLMLFAQLKYLLYPTDIATPSNPARISQIAILNAPDAFSSLSFCAGAGEKNYLCQVRPGGRGTENFRITLERDSPEWVVTVRVVQPPEVLMVSLKDFPMSPGVDFNLVLRPSSEQVYRLRLPEMLPLPAYRFQVFGIDESGNLTASTEKQLEPST